MAIIVIKMNAMCWPFCFQEAGSIYGYMTANGYDSLIKVLRNMIDDNKRKLVAKVQERVSGSGIEMLIRFIQMQVNRELVVNTVLDFASKNWLPMVVNL